MTRDFVYTIHQNFKMVPTFAHSPDPRMPHKTRIISSNKAIKSLNVHAPKETSWASDDAGIKARLLFCQIQYFFFSLSQNRIKEIWPFGNQCQRYLFFHFLDAVEKRISFTRENAFHYEVIKSVLLFQGKKRKWQFGCSKKPHEMWREMKAKEPVGEALNSNTGVKIETHQGERTQDSCQLCFRKSRGSFACRISGAWGERWCHQNKCGASGFTEQVWGGVKEEGLQMVWAKTYGWMDHRGYVGEWWIASFNTESNSLKR